MRIPAEQRKGIPVLPTTVFQIILASRMRVSWLIPMGAHGNRFPLRADRAVFPPRFAGSRIMI
jgi:hypothetical protein